MQVQPANRIQLIIGHKRPEFNIWPGHQFATLNPIEENDFKLDQDFELKDELPDELIGEYYFLFLLRRKLQKIDGIESVTISQYRRFVAIKSVGLPSDNMSYSNVINPNQASDPSIARLICPKKMAGWYLQSLRTAPTSASITASITSFVIGLDFCPTHQMQIY